jgi:hypothetical protein
VARNTVEVLINLNKTGTGAQDAEKELTGLEKATRVAGAAMATFATKETVRAVYELGKLGAQSLRTQRSFEAISGSASEAEKRLDAMRRATRGAISEQAMMAQASRLMQMGLANNSQELEEMTGMAVRLGTAMGRDANQSIEEFALLMSNMSIPRLDTFGISAGGVRTRIKALQAATKDMTREEAFAIAVREEGTTAMARLGEATDDEMLAFERLEASTENLNAAFAERLAPAVAEVAGVLAEQATAVLEHKTTMDEYERSLWRAALTQEEIGAASALSQGQLGDYAEMVGMAAIETEVFAEASGAAAAAQDGLATSARTVAGAFGELEFDDETLWKMALASGASLDQLGDLAQVLGVATDAEVQHTMEAYALVEAFGAGAMGAEELALKYDYLGDAHDAVAMEAVALAEDTMSVGQEMATTSEEADELGLSLYDTHDAFDETVRRAGRLREALANLRAMAQGTKSAMENLADAMGGGGEERQTGGIMRSGVALVGEGGPELAFLGRGTRVIPAWESRQVLRSMTDNRQYHRGGDTFIIQDPLTAAMLLEERRRAIARNLRANM